jgi:tetratricopeptide (TPR) repeat protein
MSAIRLFAALVLAASLLWAPAPAAGWEPQRGSPERTAIMESLRPLVERDLGQKLLFRVVALNVEGPWAYVSVRPLNAAGQPLDWSGTRFAGPIASGSMSDSILALLKGAGQNWSVVEYALGPTDVAWEEWIDRHKLSRRLFEAAYEKSQAAPPPAQAQPPAPVPSRTDPVQTAPGWRQWTLGDVRLETPESWQSLDSMISDLVLGGQPWSVTFSDKPMSSGRGMMLVLAWANDEYLFSASLSDNQILGKGRQVFANDLVGTRIFFRIRDRYNDAQGWDVVTNAPLKGGRFLIGCRAPAGMWPRVQDTCERVLGTVMFASLESPPKPADAPVASVVPKGEPPAASQSPSAQPSPAAGREQAFKFYTAALEHLEKFEKSQAVDDWKAGFEAAQNAVEADPGTADYWRVLGYAYSLGTGEMELAGALAEEAYEKAIALDPKNSGTRMLLAAELIKRTSYARALDNVEAALTIKADLATSPVVADMCRLYILDELTARGVEFFTKLSAAHPRNHSARLGLAILLKESGRRAEALPLAEKVGNDPQAPQTDAEHARALIKAWKE